MAPAHAAQRPQARFLLDCRPDTPAEEWNDTGEHRKQLQSNYLDKNTCISFLITGIVFYVNATINDTNNVNC